MYVKQSDYKLDESSSHITQASLFNKILDKSSSTINSKNSHGETALHMALYSHSITATDALLKQKHPQLTPDGTKIGGCRTDTFTYGLLLRVYKARPGGAPCVETAWREPGDAPARAVTLTDHVGLFHIDLDR